MKGFIQKIAISCVIIFVLIIGLNYLYMKYGIEYSIFDVPEEIEICNLGNSHAYFGINYFDVDERKCYNFARPSQPLEYDKVILEKYFEKISNNAIVYVSISYFTFYDEDYIDKDEKNPDYYRVLYPWEIIDWNVKTAMLNTFPIVVEYSKIPHTLYYILVDSKKATLNTDDKTYDMLITTDCKLDEQEKNRLAETVEETVEKHFAAIEDCENWMVNEHKIQILHQIIEICNKKNCKIIFVTPPYSDVYNNEVERKNPGFIDYFEKQTELLAKECGVSYYNYSRDDRFTMRYDWYFDADHLNEDGARVFTHILLEETGVIQW